ncbi:hypothetical protein [[Clostridium] innocuum]|nr:hypothetical protein [[Clostridium] innocuum]MBV4168897.1 hypothetical protein [[Clostridium] innocuum]MCQ4707686.1 hypothetical protein [[Clostridium] innocuum]MCR0277312.1 hypothetical protein [[Clostridium] innocuum]MCR0291231.1 hypothetical protein [[Clostridium] innocuum]MCR0364342.1 hypothetical protein [[Clostridium] innocuum]
MVDEMEEAKRMSNLGAYQWLTTAAKKVGGPKNLVLIIAGTGAVVYKGSEIVVKKTVKEIKKKIRIHQLTEIADTKVYSVTAEGISNEGLAFKIGDQFRVLETDKDAVLIEKIDDDNNPYFVSEELLTNISNYKR